MEKFTVTKPSRTHQDVQVPFFEIDSETDKDGEHYVEVENSYGDTACCYVKVADLERLHAWLGQLLEK